MTGKTYFTTTYSDDPAGVTRWHLTDDPTERRRLRARGWRRVTVAEMAPAVRRLVTAIPAHGTYLCRLVQGDVVSIANAAASYR